MSLVMRLRRYLPGIVLGAAAIFRLYSLGKRDFWYDEAFTANMIRHDWSSMWSEIAYDVHPPLHYLLLKAYSMIAGTGVVGLRMFSVVFGLASVWLVYLIGKALFTKRAGLYASFLAALSPFAIQYSQENRMYALYSFLILLAVYCFVRGMSSRSDDRWWVGWGASFAFACLTHYMALLFGACFLAAWFIMRLDLKLLGSAQLRLRLKAIKDLFPSKGMLAGAMVGFLIFLPWLQTFLIQLARSKNISSFKIPPTFGDLATNLQIFLLGTPKGELSPWSSNPNTLPGLSTETITFLVVVGTALIIIHLLHRSTRKTLFLLSLSFGLLVLSYLLSSFDKYYFISRYVLPAAYIIYVLLGYWLSLLPRIRTGAAFALYMTALLLIQPTSNSQGFNELAAHLPEYSSFHFYSLNTFDYMLAKYYVGPDRLTLYNTNWPPYDSRPWPGIGYSTKRAENFEELKNDSQGIVIWNVQLPLEQRDDHNFDTSQFERIAKYQNVELYRPKQFIEQP